MRIIFILLFLSLKICAADRSGDLIFYNKSYYSASNEILLKVLKQRIKVQYLDEMNSEIEKNPSQEKEIKKKYSEEFQKIISKVDEKYKNSELTLLPSWHPPNMAATVPTGYIAGHGEGHFGMSFIDRVRNTENVKDVVFSSGVGLGNAQKSLGYFIGFSLDGIYSKEVPSSIIDSIGPHRGGFALALSKEFQNGLGISTGMDHVLAFGFEEEDEKLLRSIYLAGSYLYMRDTETTYFSSFLFTLGLGNGAYQQTEDFFAGQSGYGPFVGLGVRILNPIGVALEWVSGEINLSTSINPLKSTPFNIGIGLNNLSGKADTQAKSHMEISFSYSTKFF